jgi:hypothetical protein
MRRLDHFLLDLFKELTLPTCLARQYPVTEWLAFIDYKGRDARF